jgi:hypothetical protein
MTVDNIEFAGIPRERNKAAKTGCNINGVVERPPVVQKSGAGMNEEVEGHQSKWTASAGQNL